MYAATATVSDVDTVLQHTSIELRRARNQVINATASAIALVLVAVIFAVGIRQLSFAPSTQLLLQPTLLLLQFLLIVLAIRSITVTLSDYRELMILTAEYRGLALECDVIKSQLAKNESVSASSSILISPGPTVSRSTGAILRVE